MSNLSSADAAARRRAFRQLHASGCFVIPNPWDAGSAKYLQGLGFEALATTSSGAAWRHAKADGAMTVDEVLVHLREMVAATTLPVNADFEAGYAADPAGVARNVALAIDTGVAGISIEDSIARLQAYAEAGADCLYAPGIKTREQIAAVVAAVAPKPVNLLIGFATELTLADIAALGVRRVSVGGALARSAWGGFMRTAQAIASEGRFDGFAQAASGAELNALFR